jgi:hypothetical protein
MLVTLTPGADPVRIASLLNQATMEARNHHGKPSEYINWVFGMARMFRGQIARSDLDLLFLTPTFYRILEGHGTGTMAMQNLLEAEIAEREMTTHEAALALQEQIRTWRAEASGVLAVVDTSVFLSHPQWTASQIPERVIESIPWAAELHLGFEDLQLVLPAVVIKELDRLKESSNQQVRYRARVTLAVIDRLLPDPEGVVLIRAKDTDWDAITANGGMPGGEVRLRVLYDDPIHRPLLDADAELIDRAVAVQAPAAPSMSWPRRCAPPPPWWRRPGPGSPG